MEICYFFFSSRRRHTRLVSDWSSDVCSSDLLQSITIGVFKHLSADAAWLKDADVIVTVITSVVIDIDTVRRGLDPARGEDGSYHIRTGVEAGDRKSVV